MPLILSQRIDKESDYNDIPFHIYHFPRQYRNQILTGDVFIYYQGDRWKKENRYYFGVGVVGAIEALNDGQDYNAYILDGVSFPNKVPIYKPGGGFYESLDYFSIREKENPPWQSSVRPVSEVAFKTIIDASGGEYSALEKTSLIEKGENPLETLLTLNEKYNNYSPQRRARLLDLQINRGKGVTNSLKKILGAKCQVCGYEGFEQYNGERYIEAHHLTQLSLLFPDSLCSDNIILLCPNCHREIHYGKDIFIDDRGGGGIFT